MPSHFCKNSHGRLHFVFDFYPVSHKKEALLIVSEVLPLSYSAIRSKLNLKIRICVQIVVLDDIAGLDGLHQS